MERPNVKMIPAIQTPTQEAVAAAQKTVTVKDDRGRAIVLRKPQVLAQYRLVLALEERAKNEVYMGMVLPLIFVGSIDGDPVSPPLRQSDVDALIQRLDEDGINAVMQGVQEHFGQGATDPATKESIKN